MGAVAGSVVVWRNATGSHEYDTEISHEAELTPHTVYPSLLEKPMTDVELRSVFSLPSGQVAPSVNAPAEFSNRTGMAEHTLLVGTSVFLLVPVYFYLLDCHGVSLFISLGVPCYCSVLPINMSERASTS